MFHNSPEGFETSRLLTGDLAEAEFLRQLYEAFAEAPFVRFRHLAKTQRNGEIVRRNEESETLATLAERFGVSEQRVWRIIQRYS